MSRQQIHMNVSVQQELSFENVSISNELAVISEMQHIDSEICNYMLRRNVTCMDYKN